jgi:cytolysin (calcineurin-like family phosphatase)
MVRACLVFLLLIGGCILPEATVAPIPPHPNGELTFIVAGDSHFGHEGMVGANEKMVRAMNSITGKPWPEEIGGTVAQPWGVLYMGDMTDTGAAWEYRQFEKMYGLTGTEGLLKYPVFEASGNHDRILPLSQVPSTVKRRHGGQTYSWDWDGVHFVCLDLYPNAKNLEWLKLDLARVSAARPVVLYWHYTPEADFAIVGKDWTEREKQAVLKAIKPYNVIAIFCGHWHAVGQFQWGGHDLFQPGSPRHSAHTFMVVRIKDGQFTLGVWDWEKARWAGMYVKKM